MAAFLTASLSFVRPTRRNWPAKCVSPAGAVFALKKTCTNRNDYERTGVPFGRVFFLLPREPYRERLHLDVLAARAAHPAKARIKENVLPWGFSGSFPIRWSELSASVRSPAEGRPKNGNEGLNGTHVECSSKREWAARLARGHQLDERDRRRPEQNAALNTVSQHQERCPDPEVGGRAQITPGRIPSSTCCQKMHVCKPSRVKILDSVNLAHYFPATFRVRTRCQMRSLL